MDILCHVTKTENIPSILEHGLIPSSGDRSAIVGDKSKIVCLCKPEQAAIWAAILDVDAMLDVDVSGLVLPEENEYDGLSEFRCRQAIPPERLSPSSRPVNPETAADACKSYIMSVSENIVYGLREIKRPNRDEVSIRLVAENFSNLASILPRLPWEHADVDAILDAIQEEGNQGEYTMCDDYMATKKPFWLNLDQPEFPAGKALAETLETLLGPGLRHIHTGGWNGWEDL